MQPFDFPVRTRVVAGAGTLARLGDLARELGARRVLLVADAGMFAAGYAQRARRVLEKAHLEVAEFRDFGPNPDTAQVECGRRAAEIAQPDLIAGLGGGSSLDCAKAINFVHTNGGTMHDYWGWAKTSRPLLPMIGVPTTAGTGSEAQTYAIISDAETHVKMACGDPQAAFRVAILDPELTLTQPREVTAASGYDALSHAVETFVTTRRTAISECFSREAWRLLEGNFERVLACPEDLEARGAMQLGAFLAGWAIENSMLGASHACANPLTADFGVVHGVAIAALLRHVVRWNERDVSYRELHPDLAGRLRALAQAADLPAGLRDLAIPPESFPKLAAAAALQWTGKFNPRPFDAAGAMEIYQCAY
jgi:alcohol dehydrogenase